MDLPLPYLSGMNDLIKKNSGGAAICLLDLPVPPTDVRHYFFLIHAFIFFPYLILLGLTERFVFECYSNFNRRSTTNIVGPWFVICDINGTLNRCIASLML